MLKNEHGFTIFAIAFCHNCKKYELFINEGTCFLDAERKTGRHASTHGNNKEGMGWTHNEQEMAEIRKSPGYTQANF